MSYLYLLFVILAPTLSLSLAVVILIAMFECVMDYRDDVRTRQDIYSAAAVLLTALFVAATAFYLSLPLFVKEVL